MDIDPTSNSSSSNSSARRRQYGPNYAEEKAKCLKFLKGFKTKGRKTGGSSGGQLSRTSSSTSQGYKYLDSLEKISQRASSQLVVSIDDLLEFEQDEEFVSNIERNTQRYVKLMAESADEILEQNYSDNLANSGDPDDVIDVLMNHRLDRTQEMAANAAREGENLTGLPAELTRRYEVSFEPREDQPSVSIRQVSARAIGKLVKVRGMITKCTDVKPLVSIVTYSCDVCGGEIYQEVKKRNFIPLTECPSTKCVQNKSRGKLFMQSRGCKFVKFQTAKVQELPSQVPIGHIPRTMTIHIRGELARTCLPGDVVTMGGIFLPLPFSGFRAIRAGLITDTYLEAMHISKGKQSFADMEISRDMEAEVDTESESDNIYTKLAKSLAPEIWGQVDVKKSLLLQLVGGCTRQLPDGMRIRGDINICLVGDPGVAKSQLLKHISVVAPRAVYTTGKGSSGVGLTAAVNRDTLTGETVLEGGALVLADKGICCIDEFDKMEDGDRTAIHEVMEQQTVSIAKGGITTTLNARTAILAAANPLYGRYNLSKSPSQNINLETALLSRFDLIFLLLDKPSEDNDRKLAEHITFVHRNCQHPELEFQPYSAKFLRTYIAMARKIEPYVPPELAGKIVNEYVEMRKNDLNDSKKNQETHSMTARMLLSILRLAQALARIRMHSKVCEEDVDEAIRLQRVTRAQLVQDDEGMKEKRIDDMSAAYNLVIKMIGVKRYVKYDAALKAATANGYSADVFNRMLQQYDALDVLKLNKSKTQIHLVG